MRDLSPLLIGPLATVREAIRVIDDGSIQIALVIDKEHRLLGTITDGDIRRGLLNGKTLDSPVDQVMHCDYRSIPADSSDQLADLMMSKHLLHHLPGLDQDGRVIRLFLQETMLSKETQLNWVVLMVGGKGERLYPLTENCPKPMLSVCGTPMLEIILEQMIKAGFKKYFFSVNYMKDQIIDYFGVGDRWGVEINYLHEKQPLGTAGSLDLLPEKPNQPVIVTNGDVLTRVDYSKLLQFHKEHNSSATICVREHETQIPFGVIETDGSKVLSLNEKPLIKHYINAGVYVLNHDMMSLLPKEQKFDMPQLLEKGLRENLTINAYPIHEYWLDLGHPEYFVQANGEWNSHI